ncbi:NCS2 family permease [Brevibacillus laterosporus]|uniref:Permease n=1 Tax=Brevibacillus laterosporus TaxID=1465 RepID=A0AAP8QFH8_BRELA|nr:NCS2 family permease [Brevibacillus laterosporus]MCR8982713.1 NCS2 family permease [Brevibacillus laterosporus]MCZ0809869.1 NCS2 family permease [Brevibacillus laterosporus]MCZ0828427.1 NCS2 family permease [Brevibacillus laterosporus]MCZ0851356.1 NCS2 family permease [Brevibacillus laterosporus]MED1666402.1 NCS2 family permease [Brevibacillus laterosporus]
MYSFFRKRFDVKGHQTTVRNEILAGLTTFFTAVYIIAVNSMILSDAGIPLEAGIVATILISFIGCLIMGFWANAPVALVPGMGINAFFSYTIVKSMGLSWDSALAVVFMSGVLFIVIAFTPVAKMLAKSIPLSLKEGMTVGIGLFLTFIGLQKGGLIVPNPSTFIALGDLGDTKVVLGLVSLVIAVVLFLRNVKGSFLISIIINTLIAIALGTVGGTSQGSDFSFSTYLTVFGALSFDGIVTTGFWLAVFPLTMVIVFENMGLLHSMVPESKFARTFQANSISAMLSGLFGTSPTVSSAESSAGIAAGGKTGITAITVGILFLISIFCIPVIRYVPDTAIAPILILVGSLMMQSVNQIKFTDMSEGLPAFLIIVLIPFTASIADGIAFGFMAYPIVKLAMGRRKEIPLPLLIISLMFFLYFVLLALQLH